MPPSVDSPSGAGPRFTPGASIGSFQLVSQLGEGGFGHVWKARDARSGRFVAIKVAHDPAAGAKLQREAEIQSRLTHPGVLKVLEAHAAAVPPHIVLEYADGGSLRRKLSSGPLSPVNAVYLLRQIAAALRFAHGHGVLHLDVKPENVLVRSNGTVCLGDFGCARLDDAALRLSRDLATREGAPGTFGYIAPERLRAGAAPEASADLYAFGVLTFEALTGRLPAGLERPGDIASGVPPALDHLFEQCYVSDPHKRAQSIREIEPLLEEAKHSIESSPTDGQAPPESPTMIDPSARKPQTSRLRPVVLALSGLAIATGLLVILALLWKKDGGSAKPDLLGEASQHAAAGDFESARRKLYEHRTASPEDEKRVSGRLRVLAQVESETAEAQRHFSGGRYERAATIAQAARALIDTPALRRIEGEARYWALLSEGDARLEERRFQEAAVTLERAAVAWDRLEVPFAEKYEAKAALVARTQRCTQGMANEAAPHLARLEEHLAAERFDEAGRSAEAAHAADPRTDLKALLARIEAQRTATREADAETRRLIDHAASLRHEGRYEDAIAFLDRESRLTGQPEAAAIRRQCQREVLLLQAARAVDAGRLEEARSLLARAEVKGDPRVATLLAKVEAIAADRRAAGEREAAEAAERREAARRCPQCSGSGKVTGPCTHCIGAREVQCGTCSGAGARTCTRCGGKGGAVVNCGQCQATGKLGCSACAGLGATACRTCAGSGQVTQWRMQWDHQLRRFVNVPITVGCGACGSQGSFTCKPCAGNGRLLCPKCGGDGAYAVACSKCSGRGGDRCAACAGKGRRRCKECTDGTMLVSCGACRGSGVRPGAH